MLKYKDLSILQTVNDASQREIEKMSFDAGQVIAQRYEVVKLLGAGGMGAVYLVKDRELNDDLKALKVMLEKLVSDEGAQQRFRNEILISQKLTHPNILRVYDYGTEGTLMYFTMEYVAGPNMRGWLERERAAGELPLEVVARMTGEILSAMVVAHRYTVHRDLKPENVLVPEPAGEALVKVCDFGLAQLQSKAVLLTTGQVMGTYNYMSPEQQVDSAKVDERSDLYSIGVMFYEALTGKFPVGRFKLPTRLRSELPQEVDAFVEKALDSEVEDRFQDAAEMAAGIKAFFARGQEPAAPASAEKRGPRGRERELRALRDRLPSGLLEGFVEEKGGAWGYGDYLELEKRISGEIGEFDKNILGELLENVKSEYVRRSASSSRSAKIEERFAANLKRLESSGLLGEFVQKHEGKWSDKDWREMLERLEREGFYPLDEDEALAAVKRSRDVYQEAQKEAGRRLKMAAALEKAHQYEDALALLRETRLSGYWNEELEERERKLVEQEKEFRDSLERGGELAKQGRVHDALVELEAIETRQGVERNRRGRVRRKKIAVAAVALALLALAVWQTMAWMHKEERTREK